MKRPLGLALLLACAHTDYIQGTKIEDTPENREILRVVDRYRRAMERRDAAALLAMAHPWYFEDSGTTKGDDDYGYDGLKKVLMDRMSQTQQIRYGVQFKRVMIAGDRAKVQVFIDASYRIATENGEKWERKIDDNELDLIKDGQGWRFLSGM